MANSEFPIIPVTVERIEPPVPELPKAIVLALDDYRVWQTWTVDDIWPVDRTIEAAKEEGQTDFHILRLPAAGETRDELALMRGAMDAQDKREIDAGAKCEVPWEEHGCDWPDKVADVVLGLRDRKLKLETMLREMEWRDSNDGISKYCPVCLETKYHGHASDCRLAAVLTQ